MLNYIIIIVRLQFIFFNAIPFSLPGHSCYTMENDEQHLREKKGSVLYSEFIV